jgi:N-acetylneuraminic acid mutarotase
MLVKALFLLAVFSASSILPSISKAQPEENTWKTLAPMQQARGGLGVVAVDGKIYAIGGSTASGPYPADFFKGGFVATNEEYDPETDTWLVKAPMPTPRDYFAIVAFQEKIYCIGGGVGFNVDDRTGFYSIIASGVNEVYDTITNTWQARKSMPNVGYKIQAHVVNGKIFVIGGSQPYVYDPEQDSWSLKTRMPEPYPKSSVMSAVVDNKIIVTGEFSVGYPPRDEQRIMIYDTETDSWSQGSTGTTIIHGGAAGATVGVNALKRVYFFGSAYGFYPVVPATNQVYDPMLDSWSTAAAMPELRRDFGVAVLDDVFFVIGGYRYSSIESAYMVPVAVNEKYVPVGYGAPDPYYLLATTPPKISLLSPLNQTYNNSTVVLVFTEDKSVDWRSYSLDGKANITLTGNTTLTGLSSGLHYITVYAEDTFGNVGASETVWFEVLEPFPTTLVVASVITVAVVCVGLLVYFKKRKRRRL